jgi:hypothetical protein
LSGNHTDHSGGEVLAASVDLDILCAVSPADDGIIEVFSRRIPDRPPRYSPCSRRKGNPRGSYPGRRRVPAEKRPRGRRFPGRRRQPDSVRVGVKLFRLI